MRLLHNDRWYRIVILRVVCGSAMVQKTLRRGGAAIRHRITRSDLFKQCRIDRSEAFSPLVGPSSKKSRIDADQSVSVC